MVERGRIQFGHINGYATIEACCTSPWCMATSFDKKLTAVLDKYRDSPRDILCTTWLNNAAWRIVPALTREET
jgi:hypothetical protein